MNSHAGHKKTPFGHGMLQYFAFADGYRNLNHGSFGTYPDSVRKTLRQVQDEGEARPDVFIRYSYRKYLTQAREAVSKILNVDIDTCVFVPNATSGVNLVLRNLLYQPDDVIIYFDTIYGACEKTIASVIEINPGLQARKVLYTLPCTHDEIVSAFLETVESARTDGLNPRIAVIDSITSVPAVRFPFERLVEECKRLQILSCIDGAHGIGNIALDLSNVDPDFFVSNCHKWLFAPRGCAVFYVPKRNQHLIRTTLPTSHGYTPPADCPIKGIRNPLPAGSTSAFVTLFEFVATIDSSPYYCIPEAVAFREDVCGGEKAIMDYCVKLSCDGGHRMAEILKTDVMEDVEGKLLDCTMVNVRLPVEIVSTSDTEGRRHADARRASDNGEGTYTVEEGDAKAFQSWLEGHLIDNHNTFLATYIYDSKLWVRMSAQIYVELQDYEWAANVLLESIEQAKACGQYVK